MTRPATLGPAPLADFVYILDDDMIPGRKMLQTLARVAGTEKYKNVVLGSIGRILPFRQKDFTFPSYRKYRAKEVGLPRASSLSPRTPYLLV